LVRASLTILIAAFACQAAAQTDTARTPNEAVWHAPGSHLADIQLAWRTLQEKHASNASLDDFIVGYARVGARATVTFTAGNTVTQLPGGERRIDFDFRHYTVVVDSGVATVVSVERGLR
jgi:hypothetical protein